MIHASSSSADANRERRPVCRCSTRPEVVPSRGSVSALNCTTNDFAYGSANRVWARLGSGLSAP